MEKERLLTGEKPQSLFISLKPEPDRLIRRRVGVH
jgi:hypothetical protein